MPKGERLLRALVARAPQILRTHGAWLVYVAVAYVCTKYLNLRSDLVPKWGEWYAGDIHPYVAMQARAILSGHLALLPHPGGAGNDYVWGRGGMHYAWGLGLPILATPFHALARVWGAPAFPDNLRFLIFFAATTIVLVRALHETSSPGEPSALVASVGAAAFVMLFPTFVGLVSARFQIYEQTIATGALWDVLLLAGLLLVVARPTVLRLVFVCAAAGFSTIVRPPLAVYGITTLAIVLLSARRQGMRKRGLLAGVAAFAVVTAFYFAGNALRYGSPLNTGYSNVISGSIVNRANRWGLPFDKVPFKVAAKELYATLFLLEPLSVHIMATTPPEPVRPYAVSERWREYYSPTYDRYILFLWIAAQAIVIWRVVRRKLWRGDRDLRGEVATVVAAWSLPPVVALFVFYARTGALVTRYLTDMYPAFAAAALSVGIAVVDVFRKRAPNMVGTAQLAISLVAGLYLSGWRGWITHESTPWEMDAVKATMAQLDASSKQPPTRVPDHFKCGEPHARPVHTHLDDWHPDCSFTSGMAFAMPRRPCISFTFASGSGTWNAEERESLAGFRATGDFDDLVNCGSPVVDGDLRKSTFCEPHPPAFLLDGMRLYCVASLDSTLVPIDRLKLMSIDAAPRCP